MHSIREENRRGEEKAFVAWCDELLALPDDFEWRVKDDLQADIELQAARWINLGLTIIESSKPVARVQLSDGIEGRPLASLLPYPVFHIGAEIFLKGMWLCQFDALRKLRWDSYIEVATRERYMYHLGGKRSRDARENLPGSDRLGHDLLKIIATLRQIPVYHRDAATLRFLKLVESLVRLYYFPFYKADKGSSRWAIARYPKRFYDDSQRVARADTYLTYPPADGVARIFEQLKSHLHDLWDLPG